MNKKKATWRAEQQVWIRKHCLNCWAKEVTWFWSKMLEWIA